MLDNRFLLYQYDYIILYYLVAFYGILIAVYILRLFAVLFIIVRTSFTQVTKSLYMIYVTFVRTIFKS